MIRWTTGRSTEWNLLLIFISFLFWERCKTKSVARGAERSSISLFYRWNSFRIPHTVEKGPAVRREKVIFHSSFSHPFSLSLLSKSSEPWPSPLTLSFWKSTSLLTSTTLSRSNTSGSTASTKLEARPRLSISFPSLLLSSLNGTTMAPLLVKQKAMTLMFWSNLLLCSLILSVVATTSLLSVKPSTLVC